VTKIRDTGRTSERRVAAILAVGELVQRARPGFRRAGLITASLAMDNLIASTGVAHRALANPSFMDNTPREVQQIRDHGVLTNTSARPQAPTAATRDIAAVAARLLCRPVADTCRNGSVLGPETRLAWAGSSVTSTESAARGECGCGGGRWLDR
jgi:hypothetical protein